MSIDNVINRRTALVAGLAGAGTLTLVACSSSAGGDSSNAAQAPQGSSAAETPATSAQSSAAATGGSSSSAPADSSTPSSAKPAGTQLAKLADIKVGEAVSAKLDGKPVLVSRPTSTTAVCFSAICTHQGCTVAPAGKELDCPCHGSSFNATTGAVLGGPAPSPLNKVNVTVTDGVVYAT